MRSRRMPWKAATIAGLDHLISVAGERTVVVFDRRRAPRPFSIAVDEKCKEYNLLFFLLNAYNDIPATMKNRACTYRRGARAVQRIRAYLLATFDDVCPIIYFRRRNLHLAAVRRDSHTHARTYALFFQQFVTHTRAIPTTRYGARTVSLIGAGASLASKSRRASKTHGAPVQSSTDDDDVVQPAPLRHPPARSLSPSRNDGRPCDRLADARDRTLSVIAGRFMIGAHTDDTRITFVDNP